VYQNSGQVIATGVEIELDGRLLSGLQGRASYSYTDTRQPVTNQILANSPKQLGKLDLIVPLLQQRLFASLDAQYTSPVRTLTGNTVSGFSVFNVTLLGHTFGKHLDLSGSIYNIFNKKYFDPGRPEDVQDEIQQDGRNCRIKLTARF
jgi:outer membrane receptor for ferrienterochelin and colicins